MRRAGLRRIAIIKAVDVGEQDDAAGTSRRCRPSIDIRLFCSRTSGSASSTYAASTTSGSANPASSDWKSRSSPVSPSITRRAQWCSTRVRWRTIPSKDIRDGGTEAVASWAGERPPHLSSSVAR